jgi:hypothetical protein
MNTREKFISILNCDKKAHAPDWEFGFWFDTLERWYKEGLKKENPVLPFEACQWVPAQAVPNADYYTGEQYYEKDASRQLGFDERARSVAINMQPLPYFETEILEDDGVNITLKIMTVKQ